jgi:hypothetical protein
MSRSSSSSLELSDRASENSAASISIDASALTDALDQYETEAKSIQTALQVLYNQMQQQIATPQSLRHTPKSATTQQMIANVQLRLRRLEDDRKELAERMQNLANMSDISAPTPSPYGSRARSRHFTPGTLLSPLTLSEPRSKSRIDQDFLKDENDQLRQELAEERNRSQKLEQGFIKFVESVSKRIDSLTSQFSIALDSNFEEITRMAGIYLEIGVKNRAQVEGVRNFSAELSAQRAQISTILNSFKTTLFNARFSVLRTIPKQIQNESVDSLFNSPIDGGRGISQRKAIGRQPGRSAPVSVIQASDPAAQLLAQACDELSSHVANRFGNGAVVKPSADLVKDPQAFGKQIRALCSMHEAGVQHLEDELEAVNAQLLEAKTVIEFREMSPAVTEAVKKILASLSEVSAQMREEYDFLLSKLQ